MEFVHLSDLHLLASPASCQHGINPWQRVEWALATFAAFETRPAFSIITGDLVDHADDASYRLVRRAIAALDAIAGPVFVALGNTTRAHGFAAWCVAPQRASASRGTPAPP
jgi:3',5'-cyclic AMP phosphodiesterase CpdA